MYLKFVLLTFLVCRFLYDAITLIFFWSPSLDLLPFGVKRPFKHKKSHKKHDGGTANLNMVPGVFILNTDASLNHEDYFDADSLHKSSPNASPKKELGLFLSLEK